MTVILKNALFFDGFLTLKKSSLLVKRFTCESNIVNYSLSIIKKGEPL